ncbi:hypothetical protein TWF506_002998 [Arthrobotrys conoides]|uniref:F-box domain-containing protein n=1 Tax=Arthrobotrys conoides TaxID=74498 RepID=A0AAN8NHK8_9PEZI
MEYTAFGSKLVARPLDTDVETANTTGISILTLPNEILSKIIYEALHPNFHEPVFRVAARLAPVCRRFYDIVIWHLYSHCYVRFPRYWVGPLTPTCPIKFRGFGDDIETGYESAPKRFENYKKHGKHVKILTIRREKKYIANLDFCYLDAISSDDHEHPMFTQHFTTAFPNLKTINIHDRVNDPLPGEYILGSLQNILTTLPGLKNLNLYLQISHLTSAAVKKFVESQKYLDKQPEPPVSAARLQALSIDASSRSQIYIDLGIGNWLLSALPPLLQPSFKTISSLKFIVTGRPNPKSLSPRPSTVTTSHKSTRATLNPLNRKFHFSNLRSLKFSMRGDNDIILTEFFSGESFENVEEVEVRDVGHVDHYKLTELLTTRFPRLKTLNLMRLGVAWEGRTPSRAESR